MLRNEAVSSCMAKSISMHLSYSFYDASGKDVTPYFSNVSTAAGELTVTPAPLAVATVSPRPAAGARSPSPATDDVPLGAVVAIVAVGALGAEGAAFHRARKPQR